MIKSDIRNKLKSLIGTLSLTAIIAILLIYGIVVIYFTVNIPFFDDFLWAGDFLSKYSNANGVWNKIHLIFEQHNQHKMVWLKGWIAIIYTITGKINFQTLIIIGNIGVYVLTFLYLSILRKYDKSWLAALPIVLIQHQFLSWNNIISTYGLPNQTVITLAILGFYLISRAGNKLYVLGLLACIMATFTNGSGIFVLALTIPLSLILRNKKRAFINLLVTIFSLSFYFYKLKVNHDEILIELGSLGYFINFIGSYLPYSDRISVQFIIAVSLLIILVVGLNKIITLRNRPDNDITFLGISITFLLCSAAVTTLYRYVHKFGIVDWYIIYSVAFMAISYLFIIILWNKNSRPKKLFILLVTLFTFIISLNSLKQVLPNLMERKSSLIADSNNFNRYHFWSTFPLQLGSQEFFKQHETFNDIVKKGIYSTPNTSLRAINFNEITPIATNNISVENENSMSNLFVFDRKLDDENLLKSKERFATLRNVENDSVYTFGYNARRNSIINYLKKGSLFMDNGVFSVQKKNIKEVLPKGNYKAGVILLTKNKVEWYETSETVEFTNY
jgi:hypothetical protein